MGNTDSKCLSEGPAGEHTQALNNSPSYTVHDGFHFFKIQRGTSIKLILIILVAAFIGLTVKLGLLKRKLALIGQQYMKPTNGDAHLTLIQTENGRTATYSPPPTIHQPHWWVDQQALNLRLM